MSSEYRAARNCDYNDLPDWYQSIRTALTNAGLTLNETDFRQILNILNRSFDFYTDSKEIREDVLDKLSTIVKEHLGETEYRRILNSDCNFLVSDPTNLNSRSDLPGVVDGKTITGNKVEDLIIYTIYPFLNPYEQDRGNIPPVNPDASGEPASLGPTWDELLPPVSETPAPAALASPGPSWDELFPPTSDTPAPAAVAGPGPSWDELFPPTSDTPAPGANALNQISFGPAGSFDSDDEDTNRSGGKRRRKKTRRKRKSKKRRESKKKRKSRKRSKSKKRRESKKKRKSRKNRKHKKTI